MAAITAAARNTFHELSSSVAETIRVSEEEAWEKDLSAFSARPLRPGEVCSVLFACLNAACQILLYFFRWFFPIVSG